MTPRWRTLRDAAIDRLAESDAEDGAQEVRWMIERVSGRSAAEQVVALDEPATEREVRFFEEMVARRAKGEPLQYVLGRWGFRTLDLLVDRRVLIPRPETEVVAGLAIGVLEALGRNAVAVDLGTGCGAIALSMAAERWPLIEVWATDASTDAVAVARANLAGLGRRAAVVRLAEGSWFAALPDELAGRVDVLVSNPPYVATTDALPAAVADWEPAAALLSGPDGLDDIRTIVNGASAWLAEDGVLILEIGETQGAAVCDLALAAGFGSAIVEQDLTGRDRAVVARRGHP